jgi:tight adherence protein B
MVTLSLPLVAAILAGSAVFLVFMALWLLIQRRDPVDERLIQYGVAAELAAGQAMGQVGERYPSAVQRFVAGFGLGPQLALALTRADVPLKATEFLGIVILLGIVGFGVGTLRMGVVLGLVIGVALACFPFLALSVRQVRRLRRITQQIPDMLTLVVGGLRAGYGLGQALGLVVERISDPIAGEIGKVMRAVNLGVPLQVALLDASSRIGSDDFHLVVIAINVQIETGGNLAVTLETIGETVRDRLQMLNEIRVLTSQQRFTGYVLGAMPIAVGLILSLINPEYIRDLFAPGWVRVLPISAAFLQILGFAVIQRIVDIEV